MQSDIIRPNAPDLKGNVALDVRVSNYLGGELQQQIIKSVEWTQLVIEMTLPNQLIVTQEQFASLNNYTEEMYHTSDRMFVTPKNVMEVVISNEVGGNQAVQQAIDDATEFKSLGNDTQPND
jgi:hypothetical protein